jgi:NADH-quinone oxidoreductase subunit M
MEDHLLSICILLPLMGAVLVALRDQVTWVRNTALGCAGIEVLLCLYLLWRFDPGAAGVQFSERLAWIPELGASYHIGVDGISLPMLALTALLLLLGIGASRAERGETAALLVAATGALGAFASRDLLLFYFFAEMALLPIFLLVGRNKASSRVALRMVLHGAAGSAPLLVAMGYLAISHQNQVGHLSFDLLDGQALDLSLGIQSWLLLAFLVGFAVRVPLVPFHTWLPALLRAASPAVSLLAISAWLHVGAYGLLRFCPTLFPDAFASWRDYLAILAVATAVYGGVLGLVQVEVRHWLACATLSQMGWFVLGVCSLRAAGLQGSVVLLVGHGLITGALLLLGGMLAERGEESPDGGLGHRNPRLTGLLLLATLAAIGVPGMVLFAGEFLILIAAFETWGKSGLLILLAAGLQGGGGLRLVQRVVWGGGERRRETEDLRWREALLVVPLLLCALALGLRPVSLLDRVAGAVDGVLVAAGVGGEQQGEE